MFDEKTEKSFGEIFGRSKNNACDMKLISGNNDLNSTSKDSEMSYASTRNRLISAELELIKRNLGE